jgi:hypothetical protein
MSVEGEPVKDRPEDIKRYFPEEEDEEEFKKEGISKLPLTVAWAGAPKDHVLADPGSHGHVAPAHQSVGSHSFVDNRQEFNPKCPPPDYLTREEVHVKLPIDRDGIFQDLEFCEHGGLRCVNEEAMER